MIIKVFGRLSETDRRNYLGILAKVKRPGQGITIPVKKWQKKITAVL